MAKEDGVGVVRGLMEEALSVEEVGEEVVALVELDEDEEAIGAGTSGARSNSKRGFLSWN